MALPKRHWGNAAQTTGFIPSAACGRDSASFEREVIVTSATSFNGSAAKNPDWYCKDCAKAARLALAAESAPKPDTVIWPKPRPISEAPKDGTMVLIQVPAYMPQWTMGLFDRKHWIDLCCAAAIVEPTHFLPLPPEVR